MKQKTFIFPAEPTTAGAGAYTGANREPVKDSRGRRPKDRWVITTPPEVTPPLFARKQRFTENGPRIGNMRLAVWTERPDEAQLFESQEHAQHFAAHRATRPYVIVKF